jgi:hypothetical protein
MYEKLPFQTLQTMKHEESKTQRVCVKWFRLVYPELSRLLFAVPNGGKRGIREAAIMKAEGVVAGVADLLLLIPKGNHNALAIEMKTSKGKQNENQKLWQTDFEQMGGKYVVCRSFDAFKKEVESYLD